MNTNDRYGVAVAHFEQALARLHEALAQPENEFMRDSVIQRFGFTFEAAWKAIYRWLRARDVDVDEAAHATLPEAFKRRLITDAATWGDMRRYRNLTSHTYNQTLAIEVATFVRSSGLAAFDGLATTLRVRGDE